MVGNFGEKKRFLLGSKIDPKKNLTIFAIHHKNEHDYNMEYQFREKLIEVIKHVYFLKTKENLPIYYVHTPVVDNYTTQKKDVEKRQVKRP